MQPQTPILEAPRPDTHEIKHTNTQTMMAIKALHKRMVICLEQCEELLREYPQVG